MSDSDSLEVEIRQPNCGVITVESEEKEIIVAQTRAVVQIGAALEGISRFLTDGGLSSLMHQASIAGSANSLLQGLTAHDGRNGLDARTLSQTAIEVAELVLKVHDKFKERLSSTEKRDPDIQEDAYLKSKENLKSQ